MISWLLVWLIVDNYYSELLLSNKILFIYIYVIGVFGILEIKRNFK